MVVKVIAVTSATTMENFSATNAAKLGISPETIL